MGDGVERLRRQRGAEGVTFGDVADHLEDFVVRDPDAATAVERLARFLAGVERTPHEHDGEGRTVDPSEPVG